MATLDARPILPNPLPHENPPTRDAHIAQLPAWVIYLLRTTIESNVHFENQLHGPIGVFLESIFPPRRQFMNIAQALLRERIRPGAIDDDLGNISCGSTGAEHRSRNVPGREANKLKPDFLMVKVVLRPANLPRDYRIITVVELKRHVDDVLKADSQMVRYMNRINEIATPNNNFRGFLVMQDRIRVYGYSRHGAKRPVEVVDEYRIFAAGNPFTRDLADIAIAHWN